MKCVDHGRFVDDYCPECATDANDLLALVEKDSLLAEHPKPGDKPVPRERFADTIRRQEREFQDQKIKSRRERIATQVLAGFAACSSEEMAYLLDAGEHPARTAVEWADELIKELER